MENGTNLLFIFSKLEGAYGRPRGFWARPPELLSRSLSSAFCAGYVFCDQRAKKANCNE